MAVVKSIAASIPPDNRWLDAVRSYLQMTWPAEWREREEVMACTMGNSRPSGDRAAIWGALAEGASKAMSERVLTSHNATGRRDQKERTRAVTVLGNAVEAVRAVHQNARHEIVDV